MNVNLLDKNYSRSMQDMNRQRSLLNVLFNKNSASGNLGRDTFSRSGNIDILNSAGLYTASAGCKSKMISDTILSIMNNDVSAVKQFGNVFECGGIRFTADRIPKIDKGSLSEIKAENNIMDFGKNKYFKYFSL